MAEMCTTQEATPSSELSPADEETSPLLLTNHGAGDSGQFSSVSDSDSYGTVTTDNLPASTPGTDDTTSEVAMQEDAPEPAAVSSSITEHGDEVTQVPTDPASPLTSEDPAAPLTSVDPAVPLTSFDPAAPMTSDDASAPTLSGDLEMSTPSVNSEELSSPLDPATPSSSSRVDK